MEVNLKLKLKDEEELDSIGSKKELKIPNVSDDPSIVAFLELELLSDGKFTQLTQVSCLTVNQAEVTAQYFAAVSPVYANTYDHYKQSSELLGVLGQRFNKDLKKMFFKNTSIEICTEAQALSGLMQFLHNSKVHLFISSLETVSVLKEKIGTDWVKENIKGVTTLQEFLNSHNLAELGVKHSELEEIVNKNVKPVHILKLDNCQEATHQMFQFTTWVYKTHNVNKPYYHFILENSEPLTILQSSSLNIQPLGIDERTLKTIEIKSSYQSSIRTQIKLEYIEIQVIEDSDDNEMNECHGGNRNQGKKEIKLIHQVQEYVEEDEDYKKEHLEKVKTPVIDLCENSSEPRILDQSSTLSTALDTSFSSAQHLSAEVGPDQVHEPTLTTNTIEKISKSLTSDSFNAKKSDEQKTSLMIDETIAAFEIDSEPLIAENVGSVGTREDIVEPAYANHEPITEEIPKLMEATDKPIKDQEPGKLNSVDELIIIEDLDVVFEEQRTIRNVPEDLDVVFEEQRTVRNIDNELPQQNRSNLTEKKQDPDTAKLKDGENKKNVDECVENDDSLVINISTTPNLKCTDFARTNFLKSNENIMKEPYLPPINNTELCQDKENNKNKENENDVQEKQNSKISDNFRIPDFPKLPVSVGSNEAYDFDEFFPKTTVPDVPASKKRNATQDFDDIISKSSLIGTKIDVRITRNKDILADKGWCDVTRLEKHQNFWLCKVTDLPRNCRHVRYTTNFNVPSSLFSPVLHVHSEGTSFILIEIGLEKRVVCEPVYIQQKEFDPKVDLLFNFWSMWNSENHLNPAESADLGGNMKEINPQDVACNDNGSKDIGSINENGSNYNGCYMKETYPHAKCRDCSWTHNLLDCKRKEFKGNKFLKAFSCPTCPRFPVRCVDYDPKRRLYLGKIEASMPSNVQTVWVSSPCFREVNIKRGSCVIPDSAGHLILVQNDKISKKAKTPKTCFNIGDIIGECQIMCIQKHLKHKTYDVINQICHWKRSLEAVEKMKTRSGSSFQSQVFFIDNNPSQPSDVHIHFNSSFDHKSSKSKYTWQSKAYEKFVKYATMKPLLENLSRGTRTQTIQKLESSRSRRTVFHSEDETEDNYRNSSYSLQSNFEEKRSSSMEMYSEKDQSLQRLGGKTMFHNDETPEKSKDISEKNMEENGKNDSNPKNKSVPLKPIAINMISLEDIRQKSTRIEVAVNELEAIYQKRSEAATRDLVQNITPDEEGVEQKKKKKRNEECGESDASKNSEMKKRTKKNKEKDNDAKEESFTKDIDIKKSKKKKTAQNFTTEFPEEEVKKEKKKKSVVKDDFQSSESAEKITKVKAKSTETKKKKKTEMETLVDTSSESKKKKAEEEPLMSDTPKIKKKKKTELENSVIGTPESKKKKMKEQENSSDAIPDIKKKKSKDHEDSSNTLETKKQEKIQPETLEPKKKKKKELENSLDILEPKKKKTEEENCINVTPETKKTKKFDKEVSTFATPGIKKKKKIDLEIALNATPEIKKKKKNDLEIAPNVTSEIKKKKKKIDQEISPYAIKKKKKIDKEIAPNATPEIKKKKKIDQEISLNATPEMKKKKIDEEISPNATPEIKKMKKIDQKISQKISLNVTPEIKKKKKIELEISPNATSEIKKKNKRKVEEQILEEEIVAKKKKKKEKKKNAVEPDNREK